MSSVGAWADHYATLREPISYGNEATYQAAADWTSDCVLVEDWGCGMGYLRRFIDPDRYRGIDGSWSPFADEVADLTVYRSHVEGIVLRGVLEHDYEWVKILDNAVASFIKRLFIALFTPWPARLTC